MKNICFDVSKGLRTWVYSFFLNCLFFHKIGALWEKCFSINIFDMTIATPQNNRKIKKSSHWCVKLTWYWRNDGETNFQSYRIFYKKTLDLKNCFSINIGEVRSLAPCKKLPSKAIFHYEHRSKVVDKNKSENQLVFSQDLSTLGMIGMSTCTLPKTTSCTMLSFAHVTFTTPHQIRTRL